MYNKSVTKIGICRRQRRLSSGAVLWLEMELLFIVGGI
jgi:hypothetical protein